MSEKCQSIWIVRSQVDGKYVYLGEYASWISVGTVKSKIWFKLMSEPEYKGKTADEMLQQLGWKIVRIGFKHEDAVEET